MFVMEPVKLPGAMTRSQRLAAIETEMAGALLGVFDVRASGDNIVISIDEEEAWLSLDEFADLLDLLSLNLLCDAQQAIQEVRRNAASRTQKEENMERKLDA